MYVKKKMSSCALGRKRRKLLINALMCTKMWSYSKHYVVLKVLDSMLGSEFVYPMENGKEQ